MNRQLVDIYRNWVYACGMLLLHKHDDKRIINQSFLFEHGQHCDPKQFVKGCDTGSGHEEGGFE